MGFERVLTKCWVLAKAVEFAFCILTSNRISMNNVLCVCAVSNAFCLFISSVFAMIYRVKKSSGQHQSRWANRNSWPYPLFPVLATACGSLRSCPPSGGRLDTPGSVDGCVSRFEEVHSSS